MWRNFRQNEYLERKCKEKDVVNFFNSVNLNQNNFVLAGFSQYKLTT